MASVQQRRASREALMASRGAERRREAEVKRIEKDLKLQQRQNKVRLLPFLREEQGGV